MRNIVLLAVASLAVASLTIEPAASQPASPHSTNGPATRPKHVYVAYVNRAAAEYLQAVRAESPNAEHLADRLYDEFPLDVASPDLAEAVLELQSRQRLMSRDDRLGFESALRDDVEQAVWLARAGHVSRAKRVLANALRSSLADTQRNHPSASANWTAIARLELALGHVHAALARPHLDGKLFILADARGVDRELLRNSLRASLKSLAAGDSSADPRGLLRAAIRLGTFDEAWTARTIIFSNTERRNFISLISAVAELASETNACGHSAVRAPDPAIIGELDRAWAAASQLEDLLTAMDAFLGLIGETLRQEGTESTARRIERLPDPLKRGFAFAHLARLTRDRR
jgi:hypothetical protein